MKSEGNLERALTEGKFAVTAELGPPKGTGTSALRRKAEMLKPWVDAVNITDNPSAVVRMSSMAASVVALGSGVEPVMQMTCRDRNRIAIQSDVLGAMALGIKNILCLTGDHQSFGNHPTAKNVFDLDSIQLIATLHKMRDDRKFLNGEDLSGDVPLYIGGAANPFADPLEFQPRRLAKKVRAGADFIQTQSIFDVETFARWLSQVRALGLDEQVHILAGITPVKSLGMLKYMRDRVPGMSVPNDVVKRFEQASDVKEEGLKYALELVEQVRVMPGVHGVHLMAVGWEEIVPQIVEKVGLSPRPMYRVADTEKLGASSS